MPRNKFTLLVIVLLTSGQAFSQTRTQTDLLQKAGEQQAAKERSGYDRLQKLAAQKNWPVSVSRKNGGIALLTGTDRYGNPVYLTTESNQVAAATIGTNKLWEGGSLGLTLSGNSNAVKNKMGLWDGGKVLATHVELAGRITNIDNTANSDHATHVAGTMMAKGENPAAKGMAYKMQSMNAYDFNNHISEMLNAATTLLVSNHSYGERAGWEYNETQSRWEFWGPFNQNEDPRFGMYTDETQMWDSIAYNAPYYLIVKSSGNKRDENGPAIGAEAWRYNSSNDMTKITGGRPSGISSNNGYDIISSYGTAKNILTVGAVNPIPTGYSSASNVVMSSFSSWGPTDDGRIKPDVVADGVGLTSSIAAANNAYATYSGTSMATPNVTGSLLLLQEYYVQLHPGTFMRAATLKGLTIHTADEAGPNPGPDYMFGWGLVNVAKAALVIKDDNSIPKKQVIREETLNNGDTYTFPVIASGSGPLVVTISWTDPKGSIQGANALNDATPKLVHDLDLRVTQATNTFSPWILNPTNRPAAATTGDNKLDNVEKIEIANPVPGQTYTIKVTHKGTLERGSQAFSLIVSGVGGTAACATSAPSDANGARINAIKISNLNFTASNTSACTQYVNNTSSIASVETGTTYPTTLTVGTCGGENLPAIAFKVFADVNSNGTFDASELLYTGNAVTPGTPTHTFNFSLPLPSGITTGQSILTRIVLSETSNAAGITACTGYTKGETHDFILKVITPSKEVGVSEIISPFDDDCATGPQHVSIRIRNTGTQDQSNVPFTLKITKGGVAVLNTTGSFPGVVKPESDVVYTVQTPFTPEAGATYEIEAATTLANDQDASNNKTVATINMAQASTNPTGAQAEICNSNIVNFKTTNSANDLYFWYDASNATTPIAAGSKTTSNVITAGKKYFVEKNSANIKVGPATNGTLNTTGAYRPNNLYWMTFTNTAPVMIESVKLYISKVNTSRKVSVLIGKNLKYENDQLSVTPEAITEIDVYSTHPTPGSTTYSASDNGAVFQVNLPVTTTGTHGIMIYQEEDNANAATFFGNTNLTTNPYPTGVNGVFTLTGNINSQLPSNDAAKFYYVFYDMKLRFINCASAGRTEVTATEAAAPTISVSNNKLVSSAATGNQWYNGNAIIVGATDKDYTPNTSGKYKVIVTNSFGCALTSNEIDFVVTSIPNIDPSAIGLRVLPNPSSGRFVTDFTVTRKADLNITILNTLGQKVFENNYPGFVGRFNKTIEASHLTTGVYMLRIQHDNKSYLTKLLIR
ncbi:S8 family serine peptidase [Pseudobacter ginsenosidimutans]|uniref:Putative secreted protein (Por secretion system target) n=1 Tax=Pseudobacter ginsenosidimutans TaxID=661488 RepID=A0A4Q7MWY9_9BACT|nr:S8 family serine peptidase [Pseudobacter ginsenosidimutans]QEC41618.1 S8 family serine peptidase [Pseudobacter ginsenosidimutans]RZS71590.1 putative secreted protein (Por secretion system target) [Pseudobacter ginsenosidimutans]